jgi:hypothetical protein
MFSIGRLLLRLIVVPIALALAACAATLVVFVANWNELLAMVDADPTVSGGGFIAAVVVGFALLVIVSVTTAGMLMPALIGVLIAETFSIRSWIFHALNGAVSIWVGRATVAEVELPFGVYDPPVMLAAGLAAGFVYWAVAGWNAGVMKPLPVAPPAPGAAG